jgi:hypothetical protein
VVLIALGFVVALGAAAAGTLFYFYDKATAIDRSTPQVATEQFLDSTLVLKDENRVALFVCQQWSAEAAMAAAAPPTDSRVAVSWGDSSARTSGDKATVEVRVQFNVDAGPVVAGSTRIWTLELENQDGWRVCSLTKRALLNP